MSLSISRIVNLTIERPTTPPRAPSLSGICIFGKSTKLASYERVKSFTPTNYGSRFATTDPEYKAAALAFSQSPQLDRLYISRRFAADQPGTLLGSTHATLTALKEIAAGKFDVLVDETTINVTALDLSACASLAAVATAIQAKLHAALAGTTCTYDANNSAFVVTSPTTGATSLVAYATATDDDATTVAALGLSNEAGARRTQGFAAETTVADSLTAAKIASSAWFGFALARDASLTDLKNAADWGATNKRPFAGTTNSAATYAAPTSGDTDLAGYNKNKDNGYAFTTYSRDHADAGVGALARIAAVNYELYRSVITMWGQRLTGIAGEPLEDDQYDGIVAKNANVVVGFGDNAPIYVNGVMADGGWIDEVFGLAWLTKEIERQMYYAATGFGRVYQTDEDVQRLVNAWEAALRKGVNCGLLAPGVWPLEAAGVGNINPGDRLDLGYYVYAAPCATQSQADRATRFSPPITALAKGSGAIHGMNIRMVFSP